MRVAIQSRFFSFGFTAVCTLFFLVSCGSSSSTTDDADTRDLTGSLVQASIPLPSLKGTLNQSATACSDVQVCCNGYDGTTLVATVSSDCTFTISLPINSFCFCGLFTGSDADGDGCFDDYLGSLGCADDGYSGAIPIFADSDGSIEDAIDIGSGEVEGTKVVATSDICAQVDQDSDNFADSEDSDDDGDGVSDDDDIFNSVGCENVNELDTDGNDIPDIFEQLWVTLFGGSTDDFFVDGDADNVPDGCDEEVGGIEYDCAESEDDTDGDCIDDAYDFSLEDEDRDGLVADIDCDDSDAGVGFDCYDDDGGICDLDLDEDGVSYCDDCDDYDSDETRNFDGCDYDSTFCASDSATCDYGFDCQLFADDYQDDAYETDNVACINGCCEITTSRSVQ